MTAPGQPPQVPPLPAEWPPDAFQLADVLTRIHWVLEQLAYDLPRGTATRGQMDEVAKALDGVARLLRDHPAEERHPVVPPEEPT